MPSFRPHLTSQARHPYVSHSTPKMLCPTAGSPYMLPRLRLDRRPRPGHHPRAVTNTAPPSPCPVAWLLVRVLHPIAVPSSQPRVVPWPSHTPCSESIPSFATAAHLHRLALCLAGAISSFTPCLRPGCAPPLRAFVLVRATPLAVSSSDRHHHRMHITCALLHCISCLAPINAIHHGSPWPLFRHHANWPMLIDTCSHW